MIRPIEGIPAPISPRNDIPVLDVRPRFTWYSLPSAAGNIVQIRRTNFVGARPTRFEAGADTAWTYPDTAPALVPGATYEWTVGTSAGRIAAAQKFRVAAQADVAAVTAVKERLQAAGIDPATDGLFIMSLAYRDANLMYDADRALDRLAQMGSGEGRIFHLLRGAVLDAIGDLEGASREFMAADAESGA
jgi:hypothetical protein